MARMAYPDVPLFRYDFTDLSQADVVAKLAPAAGGGPGSKGALDRATLTGKTLRFASEGGPSFTWAFGTDRVTFDGKVGGFGALDLGHVTLMSHVVPSTAQAFALVWDRLTNAATVFELWFGGGPAPKAREVNRAVWHGHIDMGGDPPTELHHPTLRSEGRAIAWTEDTGLRTLEYYPSVTYTHCV